MSVALCCLVPVLHRPFQSRRRRMHFASFQSEEQRSVSCQLRRLTPVIPLPERITSQFASELCDHILSFASIDCLLNCSLVCQKWLPMARQYLFRSVTLNPGFVDFAHRCPTAIRSVGRHIRTVSIGGRWTNVDIFRGDVLSVLGDLERVERLHVETWSLSSSLVDAFLSVCKKQTQTIKVLELKYVRFSAFSDMLKFISAIGQLEKLVLDNVTWDCPEGQPDDGSSLEQYQFIYDIFSPPRCLKTVALQSCHNGPILSWCSHHCSNVNSVDSRPQDEHHRPTLPISSFIAPELVPTECSVVNSFLKLTGRSMKHLELGILPHPSNSCDRRLIEDSASKIDLSSAVKLRSLEIHQLTLYQFTLMPEASRSASPANPSCRALLPLLSTITSSELSDITFHIWLTQEWHLDSLEWERIAELFSTPCFSKLKRFGIRVRGIERDDLPVKDWINSRLKSTVIRSILDVQFEND